MRDLRLAVPYLVLACLAAGSCREREAAAPPSPPAAAAAEVPAAQIPAGLVEQTSRESRARQAGLVPGPELELLEQRFRRMNLVAMGRDPDGGRPINLVKNESPEFRRLAHVVRDQVGDGPVDALGEELADRGLDALVDADGTFRVPLAAASFQGVDPGATALDILAWTRDLPLILAEHGLVGPGNRSVLPRFTLRTLLRARWNLETGHEATAGFSQAEQIAWLEFRGRWRTWAPPLERRAALEELARLLPDYPLREALDALARLPAPDRIVITEEGGD